MVEITNGIMSIKKETSHCIVILGMEEQGLALLHCMHKTHRHVHFFVDRRRPPHAGEVSRHGIRHYFSDLKELNQELQKLQRSFPEKLCIFISSANLLTDIRFNFPEIYDKYIVSSSPLNCINILTTKHLMYDFILQAGARTAKYSPLQQYREGDLTFPLILKRDVEYVLSFKTKRVDNQKELEDFVKKMPDNPEQVIVQEMVAPEAKDYSLHAYVHHGQILGSVAFEEVRHYPTGISSYMVELSEIISRQLETEADKFLSSTDFSGFLQVDFKYLSNGTAFIMDVNTRTPGSHSAFHHKFSNWKEFYASLPDNPVRLNPRRNHIRWINVVRDIVGNKAKGQVGNSFRDMFGAYWDVFDWSDPRPFIHTFILILKQKNNSSTE